MKAALHPCYFVLAALTVLPIPESGAQGYFGAPTHATPTVPAALSHEAPGVSTVTGLPTDPIVGQWFWRLNENVVFNADGTCASAAGHHGVWQFLNNAEVERKYRLTWEDGKYIDNVIFSRDGQRAHVQTLNGVRFDVRRAVTAAPITKDPADPHDPLLGRWDWADGSSTTFKADGTCDHAGEPGTWTSVNGDASPRKYRFSWRNGKYVDTAVVSPDGKELNSHNNVGGKFHAVRSPSN